MKGLSRYMIFILSVSYTPYKYKRMVMINFTLNFMYVHLLSSLNKCVITIFTISASIATLLAIKCILLY